MNALQDPSKKTSINALLNPQDASRYPAHLSGLGSQSGYYPTEYVDPTPFHLRAANWETSDDHARRKTSSNAQVSRYPPHQQQHPQMHSQPPSSNYTYPQSSRMIRPRVDDSQGYANERHMWQSQTQQQHDSSNMSYRASVVSSMYSDERTALSADYHSSIWQATERASVRLAARGTSSNPPQASQHLRYTPPPYYQSTSVYHSSMEQYSNQQQQLATAVPPSAQPHLESMRHSGSSSSSSKRPLPENEVTQAAPKAKRTKSKPKVTGTDTSTSTSTTGTSKRGYNAKKRSEAAFISAQNGMLSDLSPIISGLLFLSPRSPAHRELYSSTNAPDNGSGEHVTYIPELQFARCMSNRYRNEEFPRCVSCTRRWAGDTCRFQGIRFFMRDPQRNLLGISFNEHHSIAQAPSMKFPMKWNRKFDREHVRRSKLSIAKALLPTLKAEQEHIKATEIIRRPRECEVRVTCDTCMTSLFSTSFMCRLCGREVCNECFQQVRELTQEPINASPAELAALAGRRDKHAHANPFFLSCMKRSEHGANDFTAVTRFVGAELDKAVKEMKAILKDAQPSATEGIHQAAEITNGPAPTTSPSSYQEYPQSHAKPSSEVAHVSSSSSLSQSQIAPTNSEATPPSPSYPIDSFPDPLTSPIYDNYTPSNAPMRITSIPIYRLQIIPASLYDPSPTTPTGLSKPSPAFSSLWHNGLPLLVKDVLPRFKLQWTPQYFMDRYGDQSCLIVESQTDVNKRVNVRDFFGKFGVYQDGRDCWKLKDWPPTAEFKTAFPELFEDFSQAVPVPDYVRRDGVYNIGSHFPSNAVGPDLGPKMYNALASSQEVGSKGSTRLHMDMADALNVMLFATPCEDGTEGYAVWDLFRAQDSDKIRSFLRQKFGFGFHAGQAVLMIGHDPIHGQQFYLDVELRQELYEAYNVRSYRVYQRPGDGIFIPAGCAHQVANMSDCIKIAIDFVSPENIDRCEKLTKEFREQNQSKVWKEDVLQLRTMMWFAWQSCSARENELDKEEPSAGASDRADGDVPRESEAVPVIQGTVGASVV
ncbi:hypothetical protein BDZ97DRAFT_1657595 [Flammula alnicola]|nr:hypothetical protein BDZ97DRAFT_1657595 [Flammula alnicola]